MLHRKNVQMQGEHVPVRAMAIANAPLSGAVATAHEDARVPKLHTTPPVSDKRLFAALLESIDLGTHIQGMVGGTMNEAWIPLDIITGAGLVSKCLATWDCVLHKNCPCAFPTMIKFRNPLETFIKVHAIDLEVLFVSYTMPR